MKVGDALNDVESTSERLLQKAVSARASDIHLLPRKKDMAVRLRIDGNIINFEVLSKSLSEKLISHFKFLAGMDIGEKRKPQNGTLDLQILQQNVHLRL